VTGTTKIFESLDDVVSKLMIEGPQNVAYHYDCKPEMGPIAICMIRRDLAYVRTAECSDTRSTYIGPR
jgi:hypothetical protein